MNPLEDELLTEDDNATVAILEKCEDAAAGQEASLLVTPVLSFHSKELVEKSLSKQKI